MISSLLMARKLLRLGSLIRVATEKADTQDSVIDGQVYEGDTIWYGLVQGFEEEWGLFSQSEIERLSPKTWRIKTIDLPYSGRRS